MFQNTLRFKTKKLRTSNTFNVLISGKAIWTTTLHYMIVGSANCIQAASFLHLAGIGALSVYTFFVGSAFLI